MSGGESNVEPKRESMLKQPPSAGTVLERSEQLYLKMRQTAVNDLSLADGTRRSKQEGVFCFEADIGVSEVTARQEFARLPMSRQQQGVIKPSSEQNKQFDQADEGETATFAGRKVFGCLPLFMFVCCTVCAFHFFSSVCLNFNYARYEGLENNFRSKMKANEVREPNR